MPDPERLVEVVAEWVEKAENDLTAASATLRMGSRCPADTVGFHAQQCVEKYLKALLVAQGREFPKVHDISEILALLPPNSRPEIRPDECRRLTAYATVTRYPGDYDPVTLSEVRKAMKLARRVRRSVREMLPKKSLTSRKTKQSSRREGS